MIRNTLLTSMMGAVGILLPRNGVHQRLLGLIIMGFRLKFRYMSITANSLCKLTKWDFLETHAASGGDPDRL
jgi:hypothetical protein